MLAFRYPLNTALTVSASLAQIGEFSFILAGLGVSLQLLPAEGQSLILAGALISIALNPLMFSAIEPVQAWIRSRSALARALERRDDPLAELPTTRRTGTADQPRGDGGIRSRWPTHRRALTQRGIPIVVAEQNRELVEELRERNIPAVSGDASEPAVLIQAHIARAQMLVIADSGYVPGSQDHRNRAHAETRRSRSSYARTATKKRRCCGRTSGAVFMGEHELALGMTRHILERVDPQEAKRPPSGGRPA